MIVKIKKLNENAVIPFKKHINEDACYDLIATSYKYNPDKDRFERKMKELSRETANMHR